MSVGCGQRGQNEALADEIERQVVATHPEVALERFARFYALETDGSVTGIYLFANEGHNPARGTVGERRWAAPGELPLVYDGGCALLTLKYDVRRRRLNSVECNGDA